MIEDTKELNLEMCVFINYEPISKYCKACDGYNYNCISYKPTTEKKRINKEEYRK